jgi:hypothetical protein
MTKNGLSPQWGGANGPSVEWVEGRQGPAGLRSFDDTEESIEQPYQEVSTSLEDSVYSALRKTTRYLKKQK